MELCPTACASSWASIGGLRGLQLLLRRFEGMRSENPHKHILGGISSATPSQAQPCVSCLLVVALGSWTDKERGLHDIESCARVCWTRCVCVSCVFSSGVTRWDSALTSLDIGAAQLHVRATVVTDEGPENCGLMEFLQDNSCSIAWFRDPLHRVTNSISLGIDSHVAIRTCRREARVVFKLTTGP